MLKFNFMQGDGVLEARVENGCYSIYQAAETSGEFTVFAYVNCCSIDLGKHSDIYKALEVANEHWNSNIKLDGNKINSIKKHRAKTGCSLAEAQKFVEGKPYFPEPKSTKQCPACGSHLRTDEAKQCFVCGDDWH
jgi:ribosomal protein L7/L12